MKLDLAPWLADSRWRAVPIRFLARLGTGHTPSRQRPEYWENCSIPWMTLADVWQLRDGTRTVITETKERISPLGLANSAAVLHPKGTVILSRTASVGFSGILGADMATSQDFATWTCGPQLLPQFLLHALRAMAPDLQRVAAGSTHKTIYMPDIEGLRIPAPPVEEQRRIADFLDAETSRIDRLVTLKKQAASLVEERNQVLLDTEIEDFAERFGILPFRRYVLRVEQGVSPQCDAVPAKSGEWGVLKVSAIKSSHFWPDQNKRLPDNIAPQPLFEVKNGDLLITRANTPALVGAVAVVDNPRSKLMLCDKIFRVGVVDDLNRSFFSLVARGSRIRDLCAEASHGTSQSMTNLRFEEIKQWPIPVVPTFEQRAFVRRFETAANASSELEMRIRIQVRLLEERRRALITAAVTGQIDVTTARESLIGKGSGVVR